MREIIGLYSDHNTDCGCPKAVLMVVHMCVRACKHVQSASVHCPCGFLAVESTGSVCCPRTDTNSFPPVFPEPNTVPGTEQRSMHIHLC